MSHGDWDDDYDYDDELPWYTDDDISDDWDRCYECMEWGHDCFVDDDGTILGYACPTCPWNPNRADEDDWED